MQNCFLFKTNGNRALLPQRQVSTAYKGDYTQSPCAYNFGTLVQLRQDLRMD